MFTGTCPRRRLLPRLPDFPLFSRPRDASSCRLIASFPDPKGSAPDARIVLPALTSIGFDRVCGYVEDLLARIDCPRLNSIRLQHHLRPSVEIQHSQIFKFIDRSEDLKLSQINQVYMYLSLIISHSTFLVNANIMRSSRSTTPFGKLRMYFRYSGGSPLSSPTCVISRNLG